MNTVLQTRNRTIPLSNKELHTALKSIAKERLTQKQKRIVVEISSLEETLPVTRVVQSLARCLHCSESAIWNNINQLKKVGLVTYGDAETKGTPLEITTLGKIICQGLEGN